MKEKLGKGSQGDVWKVQYRNNGKDYALKVIEKSFQKKNSSKVEFERLKDEIVIWKSLSQNADACVNIVKLIHCFEDDKNVFLICELCHKGDLSKKLKEEGKMGEDKARFYFSQIVKGAKFLKDNLVLHRDFKPGNLFITDDDVLKIGDFGCAAQLTKPGERRKSYLGTPNYISPEVLARKSDYDHTCDVWSIGCILYIMLTGKGPFESNHTKKTFRNILKEQYILPKYLSSNAQDLISKILKVDISQRLTIEEILCHPFLEDEDSSKIERQPSQTLKEDLITLDQVQEDINTYITPINTETPRYPEEEDKNDANEERKAIKCKSTPKFKHSKATKANKKLRKLAKMQNCQYPIKEEPTEEEQSILHESQNIHPNLEGRKDTLESAQEEFMARSTRPMKDTPNGIIDTSGLPPFEHQSNKIKFELQKDGTILMLTSKVPNFNSHVIAISGSAENNIECSMSQYSRFVISPNGIDVMYIKRRTNSTKHYKYPGFPNKVKKFYDYAANIVNVLQKKKISYL
ncbi:unnamed protein product [Moneuplotes crassus]|uniref:Protein kinase domain-containing protein n=1 Tax=Euplotes crassus TaxID=5936 RepID=A0AAD1U7N7_EUPCR|nr:unnamed protein product [Moneuplotes crassus]